MSAVADFDIERFRDKHESSTEWRLRSEFITAHHEQFTPDRLKCLASCFINVECYGVRYPPLVMAELNELAAAIESVIEPYRNGKRSKKAVAFVKASESKNNDQPRQKASKGTMNFVKSSESYTSVKLKTPLSMKSKGLATITDNVIVIDNDNDRHIPCINPIESSASASGSGIVNDTSIVIDIVATGKSTKLTELDSLNDTFEGLQKYIRNASSKLQQMDAIGIIYVAVQQPSSISVTFVNRADNNAWGCSLSIDNVFVATAEAASKKTAKHDAFKNALLVLDRQHLQVVSSESGSLSLCGSNEPLSRLPVAAAKYPSVSESRTQSVAKRKQPSVAGPSYKKRAPNAAAPPASLSRFVLLQRKTSAENTNSVSILQQSADFNKLLLAYDFRESAVSADGGACVCCRLSIAGQLFGDAAGTSVANAKKQIADQALARLRRTNWTIEIKKNEDTDEVGITRDEIFDQSGADEALSDSNVGNRLLRMMGWQGGGVGKDGSGIAEPVTVSGVINRSGLGLHSSQHIGKDFDKAKIKQTLQDYAHSNDGGDIAFASDFTKEERALIHVECRKLGLKSRSHGSGDDRYIVVSCKRTASELFQHLMENNGNTSKYSLLPPGSCV